MCLYPLFLYRVLRPLLVLRSGVTRGLPLLPDTYNHRMYCQFDKLSTNSSWDCGTATGRRLHASFTLGAYRFPRSVPASNELTGQYRYTDLEDCWTITYMYYEYAVHTSVPTCDDMVRTFWTQTFSRSTKLSDEKREARIQGYALCKLVRSSRHYVKSQRRSTCAHADTLKSESEASVGQDNLWAPTGQQ